MKHFYIFILALFSLIVSGCGGGDSDVFYSDTGPQINQCIDISYQQTQRQISSSSTATLSTIWLRAKNKCDSIVHFQFCVDDKNPGVLTLSDSVNHMAICQGPANTVSSGPTSAGGYSDAVISQGQYRDFILYSVSSLENSFNYALINEFAKSKIYTFSAAANYYCSASFQDGKGYVLNGQCAKGK